MDENSLTGKYAILFFETVKEKVRVNETESNEKSF